MLVLKLAQIGPCILAACSNGSIYLWRVSENLQKAQQHILMCQTRELFVSKDITSLQCLQSKVLVFSKYAIYIIDVNLSTFEFSNQIVHPIIRSQKQSITTSVLYNSSQVFIGSSRGNVYRYDFLIKSHTKVNKTQHYRQMLNNFEFFVNIPKPQPQITSLVYDNQIEVFAGYSNGMIIVYNIKSCKQEQNFNYSHIAQTGNELKEPIRQIKLKKQNTLLFALHQSFILIWDVKRRTVLYAIQIYRPVCILFLKDQTHVITNQSSQLTFISFCKSNTVTTVSHTSRLGVSSNIYEYKGREYVIVGGICGIVEIFETNNHLGTCFVKTKNDS